MSSLLQHSAAEVIQQAVINFGLGAEPSATATWPVYSTNEPSTPDNCMTVYDTQGTDDGQTMDGTLQAHLGWQIRVRAKDHQTGFRKLQAIRAYLSEVARQPRVTIEGTSYVIWAFAKIGQVLSLGIDSPATKRSVFTLNGISAIDQLPLVN